MIDPTAKVHPGAELADGVTIGPYSIIGAGVQLGEGCEVGPHAVVQGPARIGRGTRIFQFASIGDDPQDKKYQGEKESRLEIGENNVIREFCTINRGTPAGGGATRIGNDNWIMAYVHIAHDCVVGDHTVFVNNATLAGHVTIEDFVVLGGFAGVHQFCRVGAYSILAAASIVLKDVPPYLLASGNPAAPGGLNKVGLERNGFSCAAIAAIKKAYRSVYREKLLLKDALKKLEEDASQDENVARFARFIQESARGIVR